MWLTVLKGTGVAVILIASVVGLWYSVIVTLSAGRWFFLGIIIFIIAFRGVILAYDLMWGRPPAFSKRPWARPWEDE